MLIAINTHSFVDLITNSSTELFISNSLKSKKFIEEILNDKNNFTDFERKQLKTYGEIKALKENDLHLFYLKKANSIRTLWYSYVLYESDLTEEEKEFLQSKKVASYKNDSGKTYFWVSSFLDFKHYNKDTLFFSIEDKYLIDEKGNNFSEKVGKFFDRITHLG